MTEEFYYRNIFGEVVNIDHGVSEEENEKPLFDKKGKEFNIFVLTDAVGARNKKESWIIYQKALASGLLAEEIFFKIVWQIKSMLIALRTKSVAETDMKPYPYSKAKSYLKNFKPEELEKISENLVTGYIQARRGVGEIETLIEKTLLSL